MTYSRNTTLTIYAVKAFNFLRREFLDRDMYLYMNLKNWADVLYSADYDHESEFLDEIVSRYRKSARNY
jgi:hypothetical protein